MMDHNPVLLREVLDILLAHQGIRLYIDATLGAGGHALRVLEASSARMIGFDQDADARAIAARVLAPYIDRVEIIAGNFETMGELSQRDDWRGADAMLFDLGVSNMQLVTAERGFSFQEEGPLDMRMNRQAEKTAAEILTLSDTATLTAIFRDYGEERFAYRIAQGIVRHRERGGSLSTTLELTALIRDILPAPVQRKMGGHPARRVFQALRIAVNEELSVLPNALEGIPGLCSPGCRVIFISYHSLEDRLVKHRFKEWKQRGLGTEINKKPIVPTEEEVEANRKSRSAKLRAFEFYSEDTEDKNRRKYPSKVKAVDYIRRGR